MTSKNQKNSIDAAMEEAVASVERIARERHGDVDGDSGSIEVETEAPSVDAPEHEKVVSDMREQLLRMAADFDNFRKRTRRDQDELRRFASEPLLRELLPVMDNLERALAHSDTSADPVIVGVRMVLKQFADALSGHGVKDFPSIGKTFDPERHEAVGQEYDAAATPGTVLHEMQRGYTLHDRLLRPARVVVAANAPAATN